MLALAIARPVTAAPGDAVCGDYPAIALFGGPECGVVSGQAADAYLRHAETFLWFGLIERSDQASFACGLRQIEAAQAALDKEDNDPLQGQLERLKTQLQNQHRQTEDTLFGVFPLTRLLVPSLFLDWEATRTYDLIDYADDVAVRSGTRTLAERIVERWSLEPQIPVRVRSEPPNPRLENEAVAVLARWPRLFVELGPTHGADSRRGDPTAMTLTIEHIDCVDNNYRYLLDGETASAGGGERVQAWGLARGRHDWFYPVLGVQLLLLVASLPLAAAVIWLRRREALRLRDWLVLPVSAFLLGRLLPWMMIPALLAIRPEPEAVLKASAWWPVVVSLGLLAAPVAAYRLLSGQLPVRFGALRMAGRGGAAGVAAALGGAGYLAVPALLYLRAEALLPITLLALGAALSGWWLGRIFDRLCAYRPRQLFVVLPLVAWLGTAFLSVSVVALAAADMALALGVALAIWCGRSSRAARAAPASEAPLDATGPRTLPELAAATESLPFQPTAGLREMFKALKPVSEGRAVTIVLYGTEAAGKSSALRALAALTGRTGEAQARELGRLSSRHDQWLQDLFATFRPFHCRCLASTERRPFGVVASCFGVEMGDAGGALETGPDDQAETAIGSVLRYLVPGYIDLTGTLLEPPPSHVDDLYREVERKLREFAKAEPLLILIDDTRHLDAASAELLTELMRRFRAEPAPVAWVMTALDQGAALACGATDSVCIELGTPNRHATFRAVFHDHLHLDLDSVGYIEEQVAAAARSDRDRLLLALDWVRGLARSGALDRNGSQWLVRRGVDKPLQAMHEPLKWLHQRRLERVAEYHDVLAWCAALGEEFRVTVVADALELPPHRVIADLDAVAAIGGVVHDCIDKPDIYAFDNQGVWLLLLQRYDIQTGGTPTRQVPERVRARRSRLAVVLERRYREEKGDAQGDYGVYAYNLAQQHYAAGGAIAGLTVARAHCLVAANEALHLYDRKRFDEFSAAVVWCAEADGRHPLAKELKLQLDLKRALRFDNEARQQLTADKAYAYIKQRGFRVGLETVAAVATGCYRAGRLEAALDTARKLQEALDDGSPLWLRVKALQLSALALPADQHSTAERFLNSAVALLKDAAALEPLSPSLQVLHASLLDNLGECKADHADAVRAQDEGTADELLAEAEELLRRSLAIKRSPAINDAYGQASGLAHLGRIALTYTQPHLDAAQRCFDQALELSGRFNDARGRARALRHLGEIALLREDPAAAGKLFGKAYGLATNCLGRCHAQLGLVAAAGLLDEPDRSSWQHALEGWRRLLDDECGGEPLDGCMDSLAYMARLSPRVAELPEAQAQGSDD